MRTHFFSILALVAIAPFAFGQSTDIKETAAGTVVGRKTTSKLGFYGKVPIVKPSSSSQAALTDSTTGTAATTLAAGVGVQKFTVPLTSLATGLSTSAIDLLTNLTPGFKGKILNFQFVPTIAGTGTSASQTFNLEVGTTNVTGGSLVVTLAGTATVGVVTSATAITAGNTFTASDTISIEMAAGGTVFTAGAGYFVITVQNMDTADAVASLARQGNAIRAALVALGLAAGS
jgi:hypothetical protein